MFYPVLKIMLVLLALSSTANAAVIEGPVTRVKDGDSLYIRDTEIRLIDIDAFEFTQTCASRSGQTQCGVHASNALRALIKGQNVRCVGNQRDRYERLLATCYIGSKNINETMVRLGWAVNYRNGSKYNAAQLDAKKQQHGAWSGDFMDPYKYRRKSRLDMKSEAQFARDVNEQGECVIKGNINASGEKIYHTPWGSASYKRTKVSPKYGERWFCTEREAELAGWRAPSG